jgi:chromosome segregation ATPase
MAEEQAGGMPEKPETKEEEQKQPNLTDVQAELEKMRKALKDANKEAADRRKRLDELEAEEKKRKEAELSEVQKLQKQLADAKAAAEAREKEVETLRLRSAVESAATKLAFLNPADAYLLADLSGVEMTSDGKATGVEDALKALLKDRPYLANGSKPDGKGTPRPGQQTQGREPPTDDLLERKRREGGYSSI